MKIRRLVLVSTVLLALMCLTGYLLYPNPPLAELSMAREKLAMAEKVKAPQYAKSNWRKAKASYDSAMATWSAENERFFFFRSYASSKDYALESINFAEDAAEEASVQSKVAFKSYSNRLKSIGAQLKLFENGYKNLPMTKAQQTTLAKSKLMHQELSNTLNTGNTIKMEKQLEKLEEGVGELVVFAKSTLETFTHEVPTWKKWVNSGIETSRKTGSSLIVVDKYERTFYLYNKGKLLSTFSIELGANWLGDKLKSGDKTTPEGHYKVLRKKANGQTKYYKALLLDYPNEEDKQRFKRNKANGLIPQNATIGNLIEIHGDGGKGVDWTDGCIALENQDMDKIWSSVRENTPVIIVGSLQTPKVAH